MNVEKLPGDCAPCHSERSEGSQALAHDSPATQTLRFAQGDMFDIPSLFIKVHDRVLGPVERCHLGVMMNSDKQHREARPMSF